MALAENVGRIEPVHVRVRRPERELVERVVELALEGRLDVVAQGAIPPTVAYTSASSIVWPEVGRPLDVGLGDLAVLELVRDSARMIAKLESSSPPSDPIVLKPASAQWRRDDLWHHVGGGRAEPLVDYDLAVLDPLRQGWSRGPIGRLGWQDAVDEQVGAQVLIGDRLRLLFVFVLLLPPSPFWPSRRCCCRCRGRRGGCGCCCCSCGRRRRRRWRVLIVLISGPLIRRIVLLRVTMIVLIVSRICWRSLLQDDHGWRASCR